MEKAICILVNSCRTYEELLDHISKYGRRVDFNNEEQLKNTNKRIFIGIVLHKFPIIWKSAPEAGQYDCATYFLKLVMPDGKHHRVRAMFLGDVVQRLNNVSIRDNDVIVFLNPRIMESIEHTTFSLGPKNAVVWVWKPNNLDSSKATKLLMSPSVPDPSQDSGQGVIEEDLAVERALSESNLSVLSLAKEIEPHSVSVPNPLNDKDLAKPHCQYQESGKSGTDCCQSLRKSKSTGYVSGEDISWKRRKGLEGRDDFLVPAVPKDVPQHHNNCSHQCCNSYWPHYCHPPPMNCCRVRAGCHCHPSVLPPPPPPSTSQQDNCHHSQIGSYHPQQDNCQRSQHSCQRSQYSCQRSQLSCQIPQQNNLPHCCQSNYRPHYYGCNYQPNCCSRHTACYMHQPKNACCSSRSPPSQFQTTQQFINNLDSNLRLDPNRVSTPNEDRVEAWVREATTIDASPPCIEIPDDTNEADDEIQILQEVKNVKVAKKSKLVLQDVLPIAPQFKKRKLFTVPDGSDIFINTNRPPNENQTKPISVDDDDDDDLSDSSCSEIINTFDDKGYDNEEKSSSTSNATIELDSSSDKEITIVAELKNSKETKLPKIERAHTPASHTSSVFFDAREIKSDESSPEQISSDSSNLFKNLSGRALKSLKQLFNFLDDDYRLTAEKKLKVANEMFEVHGVLIGLLPEISDGNYFTIVKGACHYGCNVIIPYNLIPQEEYRRIRCKHCHSITHRMCPACLRKGIKKPLCLMFSFEIHLLNGKDVLRIQVTGKDAEKFLGCCVKRYMTTKKVAEGIFRLVKHVMIKSIPNSWKECFILGVTVKTAVLNGKVVPQLCKTILENCLIYKGGKYKLPAELQLPAVQ